MNILLRFVGTCAVICLLVAGTFWTLDRTVGAQEEDTPAPAYSLEESSLTSDMQSVIADNSDLDISISLTDLQTGKNYHFGDTSSFTAASLTKLLTATLFLHKVELSQASLSDTIGAGSAGSQLEKLIVDSDNDAWHAFNASLTTDAIQQYAREMGIESYDSAENVIDSDDVALLLGKLARGQLLNNADTNQLLSYMQRANMRNFLVAGAPDGATAYHKIGYLSDRLHDAGLVKKGDRAFVLVIFSKSRGGYDFGRGANLFQGITGQVSGLFFDR
jgi:beta-lactamase class A